MKKLIFLLTIIFMQNCWAPKEGSFFSALRERESKGKINTESLWAQEYPEAASKLSSLRKSMLVNNEQTLERAVESVHWAICEFPLHAPRFMNEFHSLGRLVKQEMLKDSLEDVFMRLMIYADSDKDEVYHPILEGFVKRYKLNVNFTSDKIFVINPDDKQSPLHAAGLFNRLSLARLLLKMGADKTIKNSEGLTPEEFVRKYGNQEEYRDILALLKIDE